MTESLKRRTRDDIMRRWVNVRTPGHELYGKPDFDDSHIQSIRWAGAHPASIEELQSYGPHFPLVQAIRDSTRKSRPTRLWLLNGDTWGGSGGWGVSTSSQQAMVRNLVQSTDIPWTILPFSAIDAARIEHDSIRVLAQDEESWETYIHTQAEMPAGAHWEPVHECIEGTGYGTLPNGTYGYVPYASMEEIPAEIREFFDSEGKVLLNYRERVQHHTVFGHRVRKWDARQFGDYATGDIKLTYPSGNPVTGLYVPPVYRQTGRILRDRNGDWTQLESGEWSQTRSRHTLGQSVFRAAYRGDNGKRYWANFLSGIDDSPTGSGYFLVQLPKSADVSNVSSAIESLKPQSVRAAESMGVEVKRQGDLFAIPTEFSLKQLRAMGADIRQSAKASESKRAAIRTRWEDRFTTALIALGMPTSSWEYRQHPDNVQWRKFKSMQAHYSEMARRELREWDATHKIHTQRELYGTRHVGTEVAILPNGVTLARGTLRHSGGQHRYLSLGKVWHIIARNTVPLAR